MENCLPNLQNQNAIIFVGHGFGNIFWRAIKIFFSFWTSMFRMSDTGRDVDAWGKNEFRQIILSNINS